MQRPARGKLKEADARAKTTSCARSQRPRPWQHIVGKGQLL